MYESLRDWCKASVKIYQAGNLLPTGERAASVELSVDAYVVNDSKLITDKNGKEYACQAIVYLPAELDIAEIDQVTIPGSTRKYEIRKLVKYMDGNTGSVDCQVIYL